MASLFRNSRFIITRFSCFNRTATTVAATSGTQVKTTGATSNPPQASHSANQAKIVARDFRRSSPADPIKPRPAGEPSYIPLVGTSLNTWGQIGFGIVLAISAYFFYINYLTNPEFYKSLSVSREASKRDAQKKNEHHDASGGHKH